MSVNKKRVVIAVLVFVILSAITLGGLVWTVTQGVRAAKFSKTVATVTECKTEDLGGEEVNVTVLVTFEADGQTYENASYIGDLNRCYVGLKMNVYFQKGGDMGYVYSKSSDLGFALIMLCCGAVWIGVSAVVTLWLRRAGYFRGTNDGEIDDGGASVNEQYEDGEY